MAVPGALVGGGVERGVLGAPVAQQQPRVQPPLDGGGHDLFRWEKGVPGPVHNLGQPLCGHQVSLIDDQNVGDVDLVPVRLVLRLPPFLVGLGVDGGYA